MSVRCMTWVFYDSQAEGFDRLVLLALADEADDEGGNCFPSLARVALKARCHRDTAIEAVKRLEAAGELLVLRPAVAGRGRHNRYTLPMGRNPVELAGRIRWPAPVLSPEALERWERADGGRDQDLEGSVGETDHSARPSASVDNPPARAQMVGATPRNGRDEAPKRSDPSDLTPLPVDRPAPSATPSAPPAPPGTPDRFVRGTAATDDGELIGANLDGPAADAHAGAARARDALRNARRARATVGE